MPELTCSATKFGDWIAGFLPEKITAEMDIFGNSDKIWI